MKRVLILSILAILLLAGVGYTSYQKAQQPKPAPTTVPISQYNTAVQKTKDHDAAYEYRLKQVADQLIVKDQLIQARTAQRDSLCTTYKAFKPAPTPAQCQ